MVVVEDGSSFQQIPTITGLLAYRKDNESLHLRTNDTWKVLAEDKKMQAQVAGIEKYVQIQVRAMTKECYHFRLTKMQVYVFHKN